jgi:hypothetical protein
MENAPATRGRVEAETTALVRPAAGQAKTFSAFACFGTSYQDVTGVLYVCQGGSITFKATPDSCKDPFPGGEPRWSGSSGASGTGPTKQVSFTTLSSSSTDYKTVTAKCGNLVTANVVVGKVGIVWPKAPGEGGQLKDTFLSDNNCYRQSRDAVISGALGGDMNAKRLARVQGSLTPEGVSGTGLLWEMPASIGTLSSVTIGSPEHTPPASANTGTLKLKARYGGEDLGCEDTVQVQVFADYLARDINNFLAVAGQPCSPIGLADGSLTGITGFSCGPAASHAAYGQIGYLNSIKTWTSVQEVPWSTFLTTSLQRGDVLEIKIHNYETQAKNTIHWSTVYAAGTGSIAITYAGDSTSAVFRSDAVSNYYQFYWNRWHYVALFGDYDDKAVDFPDWLQNSAYVTVYRHP